MNSFPPDNIFCVLELGCTLLKCAYICIYVFSEFVVPHNSSCDSKRSVSLIANKSKLLPIYCAIKMIFYRRVNCRTSNIAFAYFPDQK